MIYIHVPVHTPELQSLWFPAPFYIFKAQIRRIYISEYLHNRIILITYTMNRYTSKGYEGTASDHHSSTREQSNLPGATLDNSYPQSYFTSSWMNEINGTYNGCDVIWVKLPCSNPKMVKLIFISHQKGALMVQRIITSFPLYRFPTS